ncbi:MAG TPA: hypothetical protein VGF43_18265 [Dongiaceae bacterium]
MSLRRMESLVLALAMVLPTAAALMWIAQYWADDDFPALLRQLPYLQIFCAGAGFWLGVMITDIADPASNILRWFRKRFAFCTLRFRTHFDWNEGQSVLVQLRFRKLTTGVTVTVRRYRQNGWNGDQPHWSLLAEEVLLDDRPFKAGAVRELVLSTRGLESHAPVQFGNHEIPMDRLEIRPHHKVTLVVSSKGLGSISESRVVNYHPYPLSFVTTLDQTDVVIQDSAPVER